ncbi:MAG: polyprenyl synthetase family protein [Candidatus Rifleibacteriota bacterium]
MEESSLASIIRNQATEIDKALENWLPEPNKSDSGLLNEACRYSVLAGGKRIRAVLAQITGQLYGCKSQALMRYGCAIELIHAYSLIHDDLPAMDNDDFRRGKPASHKVYGEAMAILAGDNLLTMAFEWLADLEEMGVAPAQVVELVRLVAFCSGSKGMIGGQVLDIESENKRIEFNQLKKIHLLKTAALLKAPILGAAIIAGASANDKKILETYSADLGLLFQITDDILDVEGKFEELGKTPGSDSRLGKSTYPSILGLNRAREFATETLQNALSSLEKLDVKATKLAEITKFIYSRKN